MDLVKSLKDEQPDLPATSPAALAGQLQPFQQPGTKHAPAAKPMNERLRDCRMFPAKTGGLFECVR